MLTLSVGDFIVDNHANVGYIIMRVTSAKEPRDTAYRLHRITDDVVTTRFHYEIVNTRHWSVTRPIEV